MGDITEQQRGQGILTVTLTDGNKTASFTSSSQLRVESLATFSDVTIGKVKITDGSLDVALTSNSELAVRSSDFLAEVRKKNVPGHSMVHKFGRNDAVANGAWELISLTSSAPNFRTSAATVRIKAGGDAADTAAGAGAREVTVQGIDASFAETSEAIATNGAGASVTTTTFFWRIHRAWVSDIGTYGAANTAAVTIEDSAGDNDMILIGTDEGQTQYTAWTVPESRTAYLLSLHVTVDAQKPADIRVFTRDDIDAVSSGMKSKRLKLYFDGISGSFVYRPVGPDTNINQKSDIWVEAQGSGAQTEVSCDFELLVVEAGF